MELPTFRYHPNPIGSHVFEPSAEPCPRCGASCGVAYVGPFYALEDVRGICPNCIADGSAASTWQGEFVAPSGPEPLDVPEKLDELLHRTPGYFSAQGDPWPVHCDDYCAIVGLVDWRQLEALATELDDDLGRLERELGLARTQLIAELSRDASPLWAHLFRCLACGRHRLVADYE